MITDKTPITLTSPKGLVPFLKNELSVLGFPLVWISETACGTIGNYTDAMKLNLWLRTAHHVLFQIKEFPCTNLDDLYRAVRAYSWEQLIAADGYISVVATVDHPSIRDHRIVNLKCKDAIVDRIAYSKGRRPDSGSERHHTVIVVFWHNNRCTISIDTSGEPLSKRGYRKIPLAAPMQETLAAALVYASGYSDSTIFVNPMCGSGTIAIEAALMGTNTAPGLLRDNFGFMHTLMYDADVWKKMRTDALSARKILSSENRIIATDNSNDAIDAASKNAYSAMVGDSISFATVDFSETVVPSGSGIVMFNPEYGIRLGNETELAATYREIGSFLKHRCSGYKGYVFTGNHNLVGKIGLKSGRKINFQSGKIDCRLYEYELFKGKADELR